ncbi:LuxR C-terminal-related transcriptional regulator [Amycolatopsis sp. NEAU-NG30]|uniref:LuxR C-terminal-related transcriptional regulator n=1 Tax=Amycolatopsis melonis TaxID=3156488 RepID=A0ABV0LEM1_9PSEU
MLSSDENRERAGGGPPRGPDDAERPPLLRAELSTFVGRGQELRQVRDLLASRRLVTLKGPAGVGKTRLLRRLARELHDAGEYRDGVVLVELDEVRPGSSELETAIAEALDIPANSPRHGQRRLIAHLRTKRLLLMLDNCEHLLDDDDGALPQLVRNLLEGAQDLQIVTTSQAELGVEGERWLDVPPLSEDEALQLLIDRAEDVEIIIPPEDFPAARKVVNQVDRLPLAIELIARRPATVPLSSLLRPDLPNILTGGTSAKPRHRTLADTFAWSYGLLGKPEKELLKRLTLFAGSFELDDAAALSTDLGNQDKVAELLSKLRDRSMVVVEQYLDGRRFRLLETIRSLGYEQLTEQEADELRERHADHYEALTIRATKECFGPDEPGVLQRLERALPNARLAQKTLLRRDETALRGLALFNNLARTRLFYFAGRLTEADEMMQTALRSNPDTPSHTLVSALSFAATVALCQGDQKRAAQLLVKAEAAARQLGCFDDFGPLLYARATRLWLAERDLAEARTSLLLFEQAAAWFSTNDAPLDAWMARLFGVLAAATLGDRERARRESGPLLADAEAAGAAWSISWARWACALTLFLSDRNLGEALKLAQQALAAQDDMGEKWGLHWSIFLIALIALRLRQFERAARLLAGVAKLQDDSEISAPGLLPFWELQVQAETAGSRELEAWPTQWELGSGLSRDQVVELASKPMTAPAVAAKAQHPGGLTRREYQVAQLLAKGLTNREIADELGISLRTAETHVDAVAGKLHVRGEGRRGRVVKIREWFEANKPS